MHAKYGRFKNVNIKIKLTFTFRPSKTLLNSVVGFFLLLFFYNNATHKSCIPVLCAPKTFTTLAYQCVTWLQSQSCYCSVLPM